MTFATSSQLFFVTLSQSCFGSKMCLRLLLPNLATEGNTLSKLLLRMALVTAFLPNLLIA